MAKKATETPNLPDAALVAVGKAFANADTKAANVWRNVITLCVTRFKGELPNAASIKRVQDTYQETATENGATWTTSYRDKARSECKQIVERYPLVSQALETLETKGIRPDRHQIVVVARAIKNAGESAVKGVKAYMDGKATQAKAIKSFAALAQMFGKKALDCNTPREGTPLRAAYDAFWDHVEEHAEVYGVEFE